jgi:hypothetical protein
MSLCTESVLAQVCASHDEAWNAGGGGGVGARSQASELRAEAGHCNLIVMLLNKQNLYCVPQPPLAVCVTILRLRSAAAAE